MSRVAVVGAGTMGNGIAHVFAQHGWDTALIDVAPGLLERVLAIIRANFERQVKMGTVTGQQRDAALARIRTSPSLDAVSDAELVVEAARSEEHTSELQSLRHLVCRLLLEKKKTKNQTHGEDHQRATRHLMPH